MALRSLLESEFPHWSVRYLVLSSNAAAGTDAFPAAGTLPPAATVAGSHSPGRSELMFTVAAHGTTPIRVMFSAGVESNMMSTKDFAASRILTMRSLVNMDVVTSSARTTSKVRLSPADAVELTFAFRTV